jgi:putative transposase
MPDHFHGLLKVPDDAELSCIMQDLKGRCGNAINKTLGLKGACWQSAYFERVLRSDQDRRSIARYIVVNPLRAKLVESIRQYPYWNTVYL